MSRREFGSEAVMLIMNGLLDEGRESRMDATHDRYVVNGWGE